jgi:hypothetical protein
MILQLLNNVLETPFKKKKKRLKIIAPKYVSSISPLVLQLLNQIPMLSTYELPYPILFDEYNYMK